MLGAVVGEDPDAREEGNLGGKKLELEEFGGLREGEDAEGVAPVGVPVKDVDVELELEADDGAKLFIPARFLALLR